VTGTGDWTPPPPPGAPPPSPPGPYPGAPGAWDVPPYRQPARTNPLAIISLVAGCAQFFFCIIGSIVAIVTGHIARGQIKRTGEQGAGFALAGLILGYVGLVLAVLGAAAFAVFVFAFSGDVAERAARNDARDFGREIVREAALTGRQPRDPGLLNLVYTQQHDLSSGCCHDDDIRLADGTPIGAATRLDWLRVRWRIEVSRTIIYTGYACLTVPSEPSEVPVVVAGRCSSSG
jgi:uncharacterized membrane protein